MSMLRALNALDTLEAYKIIIEFAPRHAGIFRHEIGRLLVGQGLNALPALVYERANPNQTIRMYAVKWIRDMGDPLLSVQVQMKHPRRLAQLLEAYASVNDLSVIDVTLSLINHESPFVRASARSCLWTFGRNVKWPAYRLYENSFGNPPPEEANTRAILDALYAHFDATRLAPMMPLFESGLAAQKQGRLDEMAEKFKEILNAEPMFPKRHEMSEGFLALSDMADQLRKPEKAILNARLALRVADPGSPQAMRAKSRLKWAEAEAFEKTGLAVSELYQAILKGDPKHLGARRRHKKLASTEIPMDRLIIKSVVVSVLVFLALSLVFWRLKKGF
jgi:tetratricopeptide (TPR) repeat protein